MARLLWLLLVIPILMLAGFLYQRIGSLNDRKRFLRQGRFIDVGKGCRLFLSEMGASGPTVVFESGIASSSQNWRRLQQAVSSTTRAVSYDRGGLGWSSPAASARTPSNIVRELRLLLQNAGVTAPYVLVGHSFGGLVVRHFATRYPDEVAGVVLVDAMRPEDWPPLDESERPMLERTGRLTHVGVWMARIGVARLLITSQLCRSGRMSRAFSRACGPGGMHVLDRVTCEIGKMPREVWPIVAAHWSTPGFYHGLRAHVRTVPASVAEMIASDPIEGVPVVVLTAGTAEPLSAEALRRIGSDTRQVIARKSGHWIHLDEPDLVLDAIRGIIEQRAGHVLEEVGASR